MKVRKKNRYRPGLEAVEGRCLALGPSRTSSEGPPDYGHRPGAGRPRRGHLQYVC